MQRLLFLCTANFYRSRFAEQYFNHHARSRGLAWQAQSRAIARDPYALGISGPISDHTREFLTRLDLPVDDSRSPIPVQADDFDRYQRVIAASRDEHFPMMQSLFPEYAESIDYFMVEDTHLWDPEEALPLLQSSLDKLLEDLA
jgi:protein-tyrosine phosphatase